VAESFAPGARVGDVARRHGLTPQHLTSWRRLTRKGRIVLPAEEMVGFAPIFVEDESGRTRYTVVTSPRFHRDRDGRSHGAGAG
jgi:transposase